MSMPTPAYTQVFEELKVRMWRAQAAVGDEPHPSQPVPVGIGSPVATAD